MLKYWIYKRVDSKDEFIDLGCGSGDGRILYQIFRYCDL